jgi:hypothetical protein
VFNHLESAAYKAGVLEEPGATGSSGCDMAFVNVKASLIGVPGVKNSKHEVRCTAEERYSFCDLYFQRDYSKAAADIHQNR